MSYAAAVRHLKRVDSKLCRAIESCGPCRLKHEGEEDAFGALVHSIIYQQISYYAANAIAARFQKLYAPANSPDGARLPSPAELAATPVATLRRAGLSRQKTAYMLDLARRAVSGELKLERFREMDDEAVIQNLTQVKGIGRWTAEMFLIFHLDRPDVLPVGDLGLQYGFKRVYGLRKLPKAAKMLSIAEAWRPWRTVGSWYMWAARRMELVAAKAEAKGKQTAAGSRQAKEKKAERKRKGA